MATPSTDRGYSVLKGDPISRDLIDSFIKSLDQTPGPRHVRCPHCAWEPAEWSRWTCVDTEHPEFFRGGCGTVWHTFQTAGCCPGCDHHWIWTACLQCANWSLHEDWYVDRRGSALTDVESDPASEVVPTVAPAPAVSLEPAAPRDPEPLSFHGSGREYFRIWIVNLLLSIVTLGIYSAWAKVRRLNYFYRNTRLAGASFDYHASPIAILKGRIAAALLFGGYTVAGAVSPLFGLAAAADRRPRPAMDAVAIAAVPDAQQQLSRLALSVSRHRPRRPTGSFSCCPCCRSSPSSRSRRSPTIA